MEKSELIHETLKGIRMEKSELIHETLKGIRAAFPGRCYVGGSYARLMCLGPQYDYNDIDIFITGPRSMEIWMTILVLSEIFDSIENKSAPGSENYYFIATQFSRIVCTKGGVTFDLIFVDSPIEEIITTFTASSLSKFYYEISYHSTQMLQLVSHPDINEAVDFISMKKICNIVRSGCSRSHREKIEALCIKHNLDVRYVTPKTQPPFPSYDIYETEDLEDRVMDLFNIIGR